MFVRRLGPTDEVLARHMFATLVAVFEEQEPADTSTALDRGYVETLLRNRNFWALVALDGDEILGGITAHALPMTRSQCTELFIYDLAVRPEHQRQGVGRALTNALLDMASEQGIKTSFVPADNEDEHALSFYEALGGDAAQVTIFTFNRD